MSENIYRSFQHIPHLDKAVSIPIHLKGNHSTAAWPCKSTCFEIYHPGLFEPITWTENTTWLITLKLAKMTSWQHWLDDGSTRTNKCMWTIVKQLTILNAEMILWALLNKTVYFNYINFYIYILIYNLYIRKKYIKVKLTECKTGLILHQLPPANFCGSWILIG